MNTFDTCVGDYKTLNCTLYTQMLKKISLQEHCLCFQESDNFPKNVKIAQSVVLFQIQLKHISQFSVSSRVICKTILYLI